MRRNHQMNELRRRLRKDGYTLSKTNGGHLRVTHPDMDGPVFAPLTPSDYRAPKNLLATLKRKTKPAA
jgi:predicted RNA binding protein YcfA (HicA-like mRNA interferase family)